MGAIDDVTITSNADAFIHAMMNDLDKLDGNNAVGSIRNDCPYGGFVNDGTSKIGGQHFIERSEPGIVKISDEEYGKIQGFPESSELVKAKDRTLKRGLDEVLRPLTPRSNRDPKTHLQDLYYRTPSISF